MTAEDCIAFVESHRLDVWWLDPKSPMRTSPAGWVADLGEADGSLFADTDRIDGGNSLAVGQPTWRAAVEAAKVMLELLSGGVAL